MVAPHTIPIGKDLDADSLGKRLGFPYDPKQPPAKLKAGHGSVQPDPQVVALVAAALDERFAAPLRQSLAELQGRAQGAAQKLVGQAMVLVESLATDIDVQDTQKRRITRSDQREREGDLAPEVLLPVLGRDGTLDRDKGPVARPTDRLPRMDALPSLEPLLQSPNVLRLEVLEQA